MLKYKNHKNATKGFDYDEIAGDNETFVTFNQWKILYNGDPENWKVYQRNGTEDYWIPAYRTNKYAKSQYTKWHYNYVKFLSASDYRQFIRFWKRQTRFGQDVENLKELTYLTGIIHSISTERVKKAQQQTENALNEMQKLLEKGGHN